MSRTFRIYKSVRKADGKDVVIRAHSLVNSQHTSMNFFIHFSYISKVFNSCQVLLVFTNPYKKLAKMLLQELTHL
jgi:hypothetical protein